MRRQGLGSPIRKLATIARDAITATIIRDEDATIIPSGSATSLKAAQGGSTTPKPYAEGRPRATTQDRPCHVASSRRQPRDPATIHVAMLAIIRACKIKPLKASRPPTQQEPMPKARSNRKRRSPLALRPPTSRAATARHGDLACRKGSTRLTCPTCQRQIGCVIAAVCHADARAIPSLMRDTAVLAMSSSAKPLEITLITLVGRKPGLAPFES